MTAISLEADFVKSVTSGKAPKSGYYFVEEDGKTIRGEPESEVKARIADIVKRGSASKQQNILSAYKL